MPRYLVERHLPAGLDSFLRHQPVTEIIGHNTETDVVWLHSYVTGNKMYCVYLAPNEELVREHAKQGGFPATAVNKVSTIISPKTAE